MLMGLVLGQERRDGMRNQIAIFLANLIINTVATKEYRDTLNRIIERGINGV